MPPRDVEPSTLEKDKEGGNTISAIQNHVF